jgi:predicted transcriptional regulator
MKTKKVKINTTSELRDFRKGLTTKRLELIGLIRDNKPKSLQELTRLAKRNIKSVITDIQILERLKLIDMKRETEGHKASIPSVNYNQIVLEIAIVGSTEKGEIK